jgi:pimeloyl-ACP methyl ester carboxylesterase
VLPPILLLHGLASDSAAWTRFARHLTGGGVTYGGNLCVGCEKPDTGAFFTGTFRDNQGSYLDQGRETALFVKTILALVPAEAATAGRRVVLVGHSMGGLASRAYLQAPYYRDDVAALVTIGTPHQGSIVAQLLYTAGFGRGGTPPFMSPRFYAETLQPLVRAAGAEVLKKGVRLFAGKFMHIDLDPESTAVRQLAVVSDDLRRLNRSARFALPKDVRYVSVVGTLPPALARAVTEDWRAVLVRKVKSADPVLDHILRVFEKTDGLVGAPSQDLNSVKRGVAEVIRTEAIHCCHDGAGAGGDPLNETEQVGVVVDALLRTGIVPALPR